MSLPTLPFLAHIKPTNADIVEAAVIVVAEHAVQQPIVT